MPNFSLTDLLRFLENWKSAFALAVAALCTLAFRYAGIATGAVDTALFFLLAFGLAALIGMGIEVTNRRIAVRRDIRRAAEVAAERKKMSEAQIEETRQAAVRNLKHLTGSELQIMAWIYHRGGRARASIIFQPIMRLQSMGLLEQEAPRDKLEVERFFNIPPHVSAALTRELGPPDKTQAPDREPWIRPHGWMAR